MTAIFNRFDSAFNARFGAGEPIVFEVQLLDAAGRAESVEGRAFQLSIYGLDRTQLAAIAAVAATDTVGDYLSFALPGEVSETLLEAIEPSYEIAELLESGRSILLQGDLEIRTSAAFVPATSAPIALTGTTDRVVRQIVANQPRITVTNRGTRGLSAAEGLYLTGTIEEPTSEAMSTWLDTTATSVETVIPSSLIDLAAPRLIKSRTDTWDIRDFGRNAAEWNAGREDPATASFHELYHRAFNSGEVVRTSSGIYPIRETTTSYAAIEAITDGRVEHHWASDAKVMAGAELYAFAGGLFRVISESPLASVPPTAAATFSGGFFDTTDVRSTSTGISVFDIYQTNLTMRDMFGNAGTGTLIPGHDGGGDTFVTTHNCLSTFLDSLRLFGYPDLAIYLSGDSDDTNPAMQPTIISNILARWCGGVISAKRLLTDIYLNNIVGYDNNNGIRGGVTGSSTTNFGYRWIMNNIGLYRSQGRPMYFQNGAGNLINNAHVQDFGHHLDDPSLFTVAGSSDPVSGITFQGCVDSRISNSWIGFKEWNGIDPAGIVQLGGIRLASSPTSGPSDNVVQATVDGAYRAFSETGTGLRNEFDVKELNCAVPSITNGGGSLNIRNRKGTYLPVLKGSAGDATSYDVQQGEWSVTGLECEVSGYLDLAALTGLGGTLSISLPFVSAGTLSQKPFQIFHNTGLSHSATTYTEYGVILSANQSAISLFELGSGLQRNLDITNVNANGRVSFTGKYTIAPGQV